MLKIHQTRNQRNTKLSMDKAREIRSRFAAGGITQAELAKEYNVKPSNLGAVISGRIWKEAV